MGEIVEWSKGSGLSKDALNIQGIGVPVIHYADLYKFNSVQKEVIHWTMNDIGTKIPENNLLFPMSDVTPDGLARTSTVLQSNVKAGGDVLIAKLNKDILSTFMSYQINRNKNQILPLVTGTTVRHINSKSLSTLKVTVPGKNEQKYVGSILMRFDSLIALHQRMLDEYKTLKKTMLSKMFPKNSEKYPELRFSGFTDAWELRKLKKIIKRVRGNDGRMTLPTLTISAANGWMDQVTRFSSNIAGKEQKNYTLLKKGQLSYNHGNSKLAKYGAVFELREYEEALVPRVYHSFEVSDGSPAFIEYMFLTKLPDRELRKLVSSGARMDGLLNINYDDFSNINIKTPTVAEEVQIAYFLRKLDKLITLHQRELELLKTLKKTMLQQMFV